MLEAVNWNSPVDDYTEEFLRQNIAQFWTPDEIAVSSDLKTWDTLRPEEKQAYIRVLGGLTLLDTEQGNEGMPMILTHVDELQRKTVLSFMGMMEQIHAKSYSHIFTTLCTEEEIQEIFQWIKNHPLLQRKAKLIADRYQALLKKTVSKHELYMAMVASVYLESLLFYSGFFYPLYFAGQGKLTASGEIISLIIRDESIHGAYVGMLAQEIYEKMTPEQQDEADREAAILLDELYAIEADYTKEIYSPVGLSEDVLRYVRYNVNRALMNLGRDPVFSETDEDVNPIVLNGLRTETKNHDFFSVKGNSYVYALNIEPLRDEDFQFETV
ncbi:MAG: class 1b ribonucleoside-diphosphate reductase subunit beta [Bacillus thermozeamaize]|uniref:Ribonucleoside-diphosphate reductase subunit beta n=1 Tax=Bacillus thermozeamaize TaxID=230954 RepID=A0A1Y3PNX7_9BACI|nr:MAG: class 1b ribonucleoside-diphosphate reductase subunit beta [Bacillus thermozeamaize]